MMEVPLLFKLFLLIVGTSGSHPSHNYYYDADLYDQYQYVDYVPPLPGPLLDPVTAFQSGVVFQLYTRNNAIQPEYMDVFSTVGGETQSTLLDPKNPIKICVHGWRAGDKILLIRDEYFHRGFYNVIVMNWQSVDIYSYTSARNMVLTLGQWLARFIDRLSDIYGVETKDLHLIGHGLGAHICAIAGRQNLRGKIGRITGLDPAGPLFTVGAGDTLHPDAATFVDVIHTAGYSCGLYEPVGTVDFYPNGGITQPGCELTSLEPSCSHSRAIDLFAESITSQIGFWGWSYTAGPNGNYLTNMKWALMGHHLDLRTRGVFLLETASSAPFAIRPPEFPTGKEFNPPRRQPLTKANPESKTGTIYQDYEYESNLTCGIIP